MIARIRHAQSEAVGFRPPEKRADIRPVFALVWMPKWSWVMGLRLKPDVGSTAINEYNPMACSAG
jgi:hypothetical protein